MDPSSYYAQHPGFQQMTQHMPQEQYQHLMQQPGVMPAPDQQAYYAQQAGQLTCDVKPRLSKDQHDILEAHYRNQAKPNTNTKRGFAEALGVSLDKVNVSDFFNCQPDDEDALGYLLQVKQNWFQNRRAKSKQDAKKAADAVNLYQSDQSQPQPQPQQPAQSQQQPLQQQQQQQQQQQINYSSGSESDSSPAFASQDYFSMMQECSGEDQTAYGLGVTQMGQPQEYNNQMYSNNNNNNNNNNNTGYAIETPVANTSQANGNGEEEEFDSPEELNRRTITQDQFDNWQHHSQQLASNDPNVLSSMFPELNDYKAPSDFMFPAPMGPLSSNDSTVPSTLSEQSMGFPSSNSWRGHANRSNASSEWGGSRSSSVSAQFRVDDAAFTQPQQPQAVPAASSNKWQPGQSVPVDVKDLNQQFQQAVQARQNPIPVQYDQYLEHEQPLAWPSDEAYSRRDSSANGLAQSMGSFGINTPQQVQHPTFKAPAPPSNIAARRQRPRPAALGIGTMRSQSYSFNDGGPGSPGPSQPAAALTPGDKSLRRIKSSSVINALAPGRVQKSGTGSAQQSPTAWSFVQSLNSPKAMRHVSSQSTGQLAPPTPMSPREFPRSDQQRAFSSRLASGGQHMSRQPSISESDLEQPLPDHGVPFAPSAAMMNQNFHSSPPHTPHFHNQAQFVPQPQRPTNNAITENTPPQSAPASQQCFPVNAFMPASTQSLQQMQQPTAPAPIPQQPQQQLQQYMPPQQPAQFVQQMPQSMPMSMPASNGQYAMMPAANGLHYPPYATSMPVVNLDNNMQVLYPSQNLHYLQQQPQPPQPPQHQHQHQHQPHQLPPQTQQQQQQQQQLYPQYPSYPYPQPPPHSDTPTGLPAMPMPPPTAKVLQTRSSQPELMVHEYSPPRDLKRAATPRKAGHGAGLPEGPKNYTFANQGPEHFEKGRGGGKKGGNGTVGIAGTARSEDGGSPVGSC